MQGACACLGALFERLIDEARQAIAPLGGLLPIFRRHEIGDSLLGRGLPCRVWPKDEDKKADTKDWYDVCS